MTAGEADGRITLSKRGWGGEQFVTVWTMTASGAGEVTGTRGHELGTGGLALRGLVKFKRRKKKEEKKQTNE